MGEAPHSDGGRGGGGGGGGGGAPSLLAAAALPAPAAPRVVAGKRRDERQGRRERSGVTRREEGGEPFCSLAQVRSFSLPPCFPLVPLLPPYQYHFSFTISLVILSPRCLSPLFDSGKGPLSEKARVRCGSRAPSLSPTHALSLSRNTPLSPEPILPPLLLFCLFEALA